MSVDRERLAQTFFDLVRIDSLTFEEEAIMTFLGQELAELGLKVESDSAGEKIGGSCGNLIAHLPGDTSKTPIFFNCHVDTVEPGRGIEPREQNGIITSVGDTVLGADDKVGAAVLLELARVLTARPDGRFGPIDLVFCVAEEKGLLGAKNLDWGLVTGEYGFVFDAAGPVGDITVSAPYQNTLEAVFRGRAAHAGVNPEQGASAIKAAAAAICAMPLGRIDSETTANIGVIEGGRAVNIVPERTMVKGEARSLEIDKLKKQTEIMVSALRGAAEDSGVAVDVDLIREYDGFHLSSNDQVVRWAAAAFTAIGLAPSLVATGGGSDTNVFNARGVPTVNLGAGYKAPHTLEESVSLTELEQAAQVAVAIAEIVAGS